MNNYLKVGVSLHVAMQEQLSDKTGESMMHNSLKVGPTGISLHVAMQEQLSEKQVSAH